MSSKWISLQNHSCFSILNGVNKPEVIVDKAKELNMPAIAITDLGVMYGAVNFFSRAIKKGVKPIIGIDAYIIYKDLNENNVGPRDASVRVTLLAKNSKGYQALCKLSSLGFRKGNFRYVPRVTFDDIKFHAGNIIVLSGGINGPIGHAFRFFSTDFAEKILVHFNEIFKDDFYCSITRFSFNEEDEEFDSSKNTATSLFCGEQKRFNDWIIPTSRRLGVELVVSNDVFYTEKKEWLLRDMLMNIAVCNNLMEINDRGEYSYNPKRKLAPSSEFYLKGDEIAELFKDDLQDALDNTFKIADKCEFILDTDACFYPAYEPKIKSYNTEEERKQLVEKELLTICKDSIRKKYSGKNLQRLNLKFPESDIFKMINERIDFEFEILSSRNLCDYIMIVADFIRWSKRNGILVGPGRGSGVGSIILYLLDITDLDPIQLDLFFERFINPDRPSYPDIDVDVCMSRRGEVIQYMVDRYGANRVSHIATYGTMKSRMSIRDVGRALAVPIATVNRIASLIPDQLGITILESLELNPVLKEEYDSNETVRKIIDYSLSLEGCVRNIGMHAAGILVSCKPLDESIPTFIDQTHGLLVSQFEKDAAEKVGMLKIDVLGLRTLTIIKDAIDRINEIDGNNSIDIDDIDLEDKKTFDMLQSGKTTGVFQLESSGVQELLRSFKPTKFSDIIVIISLYRPGPMDMIPEFIKRKTGEVPVDYIHEDLKGILEDTYGIMVYQEQVMQISEVIAGYSKGEGDILRRAMGKKDIAAMEEQKKIFCRRAIEQGYEEVMVIDLFDKMAKFASYGFNKSHAAAYAKISYTTAFIKVRFPGIWIASILTASFQDKDKFRSVVAEGVSMGYTLACPDINESHATKFVSKGNKVLYPISGIKSVGVNVGESIEKTRRCNSRFSSLMDFLQKVDFKVVRHKNIESLISAGAFDCFGDRVDQIKWLNDNYKIIVDRLEREKHGELTIASMIEIPTPRFKVYKHVSERSILDLFAEKDGLGSFVSENLVSKMCSLLRSQGISVHRLCSIKSNVNENEIYEKEGTFVAWVEDIKISKVTSGRGVRLILSDHETMKTLFISFDQYKEAKELVVNSLCFIKIFASSRKGMSYIRLNCGDIICFDKNKVNLLLKETKKLREFVEKGSKNSKVKMKKAEKILELSLDSINMSTVLKIKKCISDSGTEIKIAIKDSDSQLNFEIVEKLDLGAISEINAPGVRILNSSL